MEDRRVLKRIQKRTKVVHGISGANFLGYTINISENGMAIESQIVFPRNYKIVLHLYSEIGIIKLNADVVWSTNSTPGSLPKMGIKLSKNIKRLISADSSLTVLGRDILIDEKE